jgi:hypothetical protein
VAVKAMWPVEHDLADKRLSERAGYANRLAQKDGTDGWPVNQDKANTEGNEAELAERQATVEVWERGRNVLILDGSENAVGPSSRVRHQVKVAAHDYTPGLDMSDRYFSDLVEHTGGRITSAPWCIDHRDAGPEDVVEIVSDAETETEKPNSTCGWSDPNPAAGREGWNGFDPHSGLLRMGRSKDRDGRGDDPNRSRPDQGRRHRWLAEDRRGRPERSLRAAAGDWTEQTRHDPGPEVERHGGGPAVITWLDHVPDQELVGRLVDRLSEEFPDDQTVYLQRAEGDDRYSLWLRLADEHLDVLRPRSNETVTFPWQEAYERGWSRRDAAFAALGGPTPQQLGSLGLALVETDRLPASDPEPSMATVREVDQ